MNTPLLLAFARTLQNRGARIKQKTNAAKLDQPALDLLNARKSAHTAYVKWQKAPKDDKAKAAVGTASLGLQKEMKNFVKALSTVYKPSAGEKQFFKTVTGFKPIRGHDEGTNPFPTPIPGSIPIGPPIPSPIPPGPSDWRVWEDLSNTIEVVVVEMRAFEKRIKDLGTLALNPRHVGNVDSGIRR